MSVAPTTPLSEGLKSARVRLGLSQRQLAEVARLTQSRVAGIETGRIDLRVSTLTHLARALEMEIVLVPRTLLPTVRSLIRGVTSDAGRNRRTRAGRALGRIHDLIRLLRTRELSPEADERADHALSLVESLERHSQWLTSSDLVALGGIERSLKRADDPMTSARSLDRATPRLLELDAAARRAARAPAVNEERPLYALNEEEEEP